MIYNHNTGAPSRTSKVDDTPAKQQANPPPERRCTACGHPAGVSRHLVKLNSVDHKLCRDCHEQWEKVFGKGSVNVIDSQAVWSHNTDPFEPEVIESDSMRCHFCKREVDSGRPVAKGIECEDCFGKIKSVGNRGFGRKRAGAIAHAPADVIAAAKARPKDHNPLKGNPIKVTNYSDLMDYYAHMQHLYGKQYGWDGGNGWESQNQRLIQEIDDYDEMYYD
jgi:hypothetical protein